MSILERFSTIMKANINALLDKCEDPAKMIDQYLIDLKGSLVEVKQETAGVMAVEKQCSRQYDENEEEIKKFRNLAKKAVDAGNDEDGKVFIKKYMELEEKRAVLENNKTVAARNASHVRSMHDKLVEDIQTLEGRKAQIKSTMAVAKTSEKLNKLGDPLSRASSVGDKFIDMQEKANRMLDEAQAKSELNAPVVSQADSLSKKYAGAAATDIEAELNRLKNG
ncbi:MAG: PspA/IM30 family protein [Synergistaceae bacterium]|jgi:phage shock protein A|nr:PspA/IM30 family protein [Synergistaceae bacterium]